MSKSGIYSITNTVSGSRYVGSAVNIARRWRAHLHTLRSRLKSPPKLQRAWDKYGEAIFKFEVLQTCPREELLTWEQRHIDRLQPKYNTRAQAKSNLGIKWSAETNAKKGRARSSISFQGRSGGVNEMARLFGFEPYVVSHRLQRGWSVERSLTEPLVGPSERGTRGVKLGNPGTFTAFGSTGRLKDLVERFGVVSYAAVVRRRCLGWPLEDALTKAAR